MAARMVGCHRGASASQRVLNIPITWACYAVSGAVTARSEWTQVRTGQWSWILHPYAQKGNTNSMKPATAYLLGAVGFLVCVAIGIYYIIPMSTEHFLSSHGPNYSDTKHALVFFVLAIVCLIGARFAANSKARG